MPRSAPMFRSVLILPVLALASACAEPGAGPAPSPEAPPSASASVSGLPAGTEQWFLRTMARRWCLSGGVIQLKISQAMLLT